MASAAVLGQIDLAHRAQQVELASRIARLMAGYWLLVEPDKLAETGGPWLERSINAVQNGHRTSALLARAYAETIHRLQLPQAPRLDIPTPPDIPFDKLYESLSFTGLGYAAVELSKVPDTTEPEPGADRETVERFEREQAMRQRRERFVMEQAITFASKAAVKHVVDGARDQTDAIVVTKTALGYYRVTQSENPCGWCLLLASRGPVYSDDSFDESDPRFTGPGNHKVHDGCMCTLRPVFTRSTDEWSDQARKADALWTSVASFPGDNKARVNEFRRLARAQGLADANRW